MVSDAPPRRMKERGGIHNRSNAAQENHAKDYGEIMYGHEESYEPGYKG
jgi:hypothetical protein